MNVFWIAAGALERRGVADLPSLLQCEDGFVWVDLPEGAERNAPVLQENFGFHPRALRDCLERSLMPKVHAYPEYLFLILHTPEPVGAGRLYQFELALFIGRRYLVTVHELPKESLPPGARRDIEGVREADRFNRTRSLCDAEQAFLQGVIDFYQTRTTTKMNLAMEQLALLTAVVLPTTAIASTYGMNLIVNQQTQPAALAVTLALMALVSLVMLW